MFLASSVLAGVGASVFAFDRHSSAIKVERSWPRSFDEFLSKEARRSELAASFVGFAFFTGALLEAEFQQRNSQVGLLRSHPMRIAKFVSGVGMFAAVGFFVGGLSAGLS